MSDGTSYERSGFTMSSIRPFALAISAAALVAMTACGDSTTTPSAGSSPSSSSSSGTSSPSASTTVAAPTGPVTVKVTTTALGAVLTDDKGMALYKFDKDVGSTLACLTEPCATRWPSLLTLGPPKPGAGADDGKLGTVKRPDGLEQVTYNKLPLYYYFQDKAPGETKGQGVGGIWWLVSADGKEIKTTAPTTTG
jgi:predicted lipoprotein with Yx(FWY)xxD motif